MKLPVQLTGAVRRSTRRRVLHEFLPRAPGVQPQDLWCEDHCHDVYQPGSDEHEECLDWCRES